MGDCEEAVRRAERGLVDADLGGRLIKQRIARGNQGAARGSRAVIFYKRGRVAVFLRLFAKSGSANLDDSDLMALRRLALEFDKQTDEQLDNTGNERRWKKIEL